MPAFVTGARLKLAVSRLGSSSAAQRFGDLVVLKRALPRIGGDQAVTRKGVVVLSLNNRHFTGAIDDVMGWTSDVVGDAEVNEYPYINVFGTGSHDDFGYRSDKYPSNGTAVTVASPPWRRVTDLLDERPRAIAFKKGYVDQLGSFFLTKDGVRPRLLDAAAWYFRGQDVSSLSGKNSITPDQLGKAFVDACGFTSEEIEQLFDSTAEEGSRDWLTSTKSLPTDYLPSRVPQDTAKSAITSTRAISEKPNSASCSLDLVVALASKNFVLLTGPSGTGKTRGALRLAESLESLAVEGAPGTTLCLVPVGADWTDARPLLGYPNPFGRQRNMKDGHQTNETYEIPEALNLLLRAADPDRAGTPHFLILDEMNLSHVERYFSSFLSLMEAKRSLADPSRVPILTRESMALIAEVLDSDRPNSLEAEAARKIDQNGRGLILPSGVFIVGTVNVDETTYMFSPKVLDRAHVLETLPPAPSVYINDRPPAEQQISVVWAQQVLRMAVELHRQGFFDTKTPRTIVEEAARRFKVPEPVAASVLEQTTILLDGAFKLLDPVGFGFAYRVVHEVFTYLFFWMCAQRLIRGDDRAALADWPDALDQVFCQKILPKIHGSRRQLGGSLSALAAFLQGNDLSGSPAARYQNADGPEISITAEERLTLGGNLMPKSRAKLQRMNDWLSATGHVSFVQ